MKITNNLKTIKKPWGREIWFAHNSKYVGKLLIINRGHRLSLSYHKVKHETLYVLKGRLRLTLGKKHGILNPGSAFVIPPKTIHRFEASHGRVTLLEVSTPEIQDIVRLSDDYGRIKGGR